MSMSNYPNGFVHGVTIRGIPILNTYNKNVYYVDSVNGSNGYDGTFNWPKASISYLFTADIVSAGDKIICKPGHVETIASAAALDIAGVCIIFDGEGTSKAYVNFTATGAYLNITGAGTTIINSKFVTGIDAVAKGVLIDAADVNLVNTEYHDAAAKASTIQILTTANAHRLFINGYRFFASTTGTQKTDGIKTVGAIDGLVLHNIQIVGDFSTAPIDISAAATNVDLDNLNLNNTNTGPQPGMEIHANTTGFAENVKCRVDSGTDYVSSTAKIQWGAMCQGYNTDGSGGEAIGSAIDIEAKVDSVGVQASVVQSIVESIDTRAIVVQSKVDSAGIQVSTVDSRVSFAVSKVDSVGLQTSAAQSTTISQAARTDSKTDSVGIQTSAVDSKAISVGTGVSAALANTISIMTSTASQALSVGIGASQAYATGLSIQTAVASQALSVGIGASQAYATGLSIQTAVASQALSVGIGASQAYATGLSVASQATSIGIGTSVCNANVLSTAASVASTATSLGIGVSTTVNTVAQTVSILNSFALVISTINSNTA